MDRLWQACRPADAERLRLSQSSCLWELSTHGGSSSKYNRTRGWVKKADALFILLLMLGCALGVLIGVWLGWVLVLHG